jgi:hypothetical protein
VGLTLRRETTRACQNRGMSHHPSMPPVGRLLHYIKRPGGTYNTSEMICLDSGVARLICGTEDVGALIDAIEEAVSLRYIRRWSSADPEGERPPTKLSVAEHKNAMVGVRMTVDGYNYLVHQTGFNVV